MASTSFDSPRADGNLSRRLFPNAKNGNGNPKLENGAHMGSIGCGLAGSFFSYFLLEMTRRLGIEMSSTRTPAFAGGFYPQFHLASVLKGANGLALGLHIMMAVTLLAGRGAATCAGKSFPRHWFSRGWAVKPVLSFHDFPFDSIVFFL